MPSNSQIAEARQRLRQAARVLEQLSENVAKERQTVDQLRRGMQAKPLPHQDDPIGDLAKQLRAAASALEEDSDG